MLGKHAQQQGSKVNRDWLRFDFSNPSSVSPEQLARIEELVNGKIMEGAAVSSTNMPIAEARKTGAMMLFGEKYPDVVRVISVGDYSKELCGGTHLANVGQAGLFKIVGEESVRSRHPADHRACRSVGAGARPSQRDGAGARGGAVEGPW